MTPSPLYAVQTQGQLSPHVAQEFLLTNGMGAFAFSTVVGCNTRRYHGLLCAATHPPLGRMMTLSRIGEIVYPDAVAAPDRVHELSVNLFAGGNVHPRGYQYLRHFELGQAARWTFRVESLEITKELQLVWGQNVAGLRYTIRPDSDARFRLELLPFVALRDFHSLRRGTDFPFRTVSSGGHAKVEDGRHQLHLRASAGEFRDAPDWWRGHTYPVETERGQDDTEDLFNPGRFVVEASGEIQFTLWAALSDPGNRDWEAELARHPDATRPATRIVPPRGPRGEALRAAKGPQPDLPAAQRLGTRNAEPGTPPLPIETGQPSSTIRRLFRAAGDFVVLRNRPDGKAGATILAGYPWFSDWGRDTMISLPGLLLVTGRFTDACQVLSVFAQYVSEGMIPNRFDDYTNEPSYNTVDASLWFVHACFAYRDYSGDDRTFESVLLPACREVLRGYKAGTRYGIKMDESDGLIAQGDPSTQLTWMDAKMGDTAFTPRQGKPVEINALWYHALRLMGEDALADRVRDSFQKAFYISPFRGLADVVTGSPASSPSPGTPGEGRGGGSSPSAGYSRDTSTRPNQIFAASLPHSPLTRDQQSAVVEVVRRELLTPYGLRTLAKSDPRYKGRYTGDQWHRDTAYHNGTVWPWLIGAFLEAYLNVNDHSPQAAHQAREWLAPLINHMDDRGCIGQIPENFDGDDPQRPVGTPAQAWSVAEVLRLAAMLGY